MYSPEEVIDIVIFLCEAEQYTPIRELMDEIYKVDSHLAKQAMAQKIIDNITEEMESDEVCSVDADEICNDQLLDEEYCEEGFGEQVASLREKLGLNQTDFGKVIGLSPGYVSNIERGEKYPSKKVVAKLSEMLEKYKDSVSVKF